MKRIVLRGTVWISLGAAACVTPQVAPVPDVHPGAPSYAEAVARIAAQQLRDDSVAVANGRSILMTRGAPAPRVYVLLHSGTVRRLG